MRPANALLRGRAKATASQVATVLEALAEICPAARPDQEELRLAADLAARLDLTLYDAAYAAVAENRGAKLATLERALLEAGSAAARARSPRSSSGHTLPADQLGIVAGSAARRRHRNGCSPPLSPLRPGSTCASSRNAQAPKLAA